MSLSGSRGTVLFAPLVGVLLSVTSVSSYISHQFGNAPSAGGVSPMWIQAGVTALSVVLTGGLVYLYHEQRKLNALEYTAAVQNEGYRPSDEGGTLDVCLSNLGRGAATELRLRVEASFLDTDGYSGSVVETEPIKRLEQPHADDVRNEWARPTRSYLGPEQYFVRFWTTVPVKWTTPDGNLGRSGLSSLANELPDSVDRVRLTVTLNYRDQLENSKSEQIVDDVLPLETGEDLEYLFSRGLTYESYVEREENDHVENPLKKETVRRPHLVCDSETSAETRWRSGG